MAIKTHLADSPEPLKEGTKLLAICGAIVPDAAFAFMWDETEAGDIHLAVTGLFGLCRKCRDADINGRYVYGIRSGEEQKQTEASA